MRSTATQGQGWGANGQSAGGRLRDPAADAKCLVGKGELYAPAPHPARPSAESAVPARGREGAAASPSFLPSAGRSGGRLPSPLRGGAGGGGRGRERRQNGIEHHIDGGHDLAVAETQHAIAAGFESLRPRRIALDGGVEAVLVAVDLDDEARAEAAEIDDIARDRSLSAEVRSLDRQTRPQVPPEAILRLGHALPERASPRSFQPRRRVRRII